MQVDKEFKSRSGDGIFMQAHKVYHGSNEYKGGDRFVISAWIDREVLDVAQGIVDRKMCKTSGKSTHLRRLQVETVNGEYPVCRALGLSRCMCPNEARQARAEAGRAHSCFEGTD